MTHIDLTDAAFWDNPYPLYAELRRNHPVCRVEPGGFFAVSRHEDVAYVLRNSELFSSEGQRAGFRPAWLGANPMADSMVVMDPPLHMRLRRLVTPAFGLRSVTRLEPHTRQKAEELADRLLIQPEVEFVNDFALALPAHVMGMLLGVDSSLRKNFKRWSDDIVSLPAMSTAPEPERVRQIQATIADFRRYLSDVIEDRRTKPCDDMVSDLIYARTDEQPLTDEELVSFLFLLLVAGLETTTHLLSSAARILAERPDIFTRLRADLSLVPNFVEEVLRLEGSAHMMPRTAMLDVEIAGVAIPKGSFVVAIIASANRDTQKFPDGDQLNMENKVAHMAFGHGAHHCLGSALARMEVRFGIEAIVKRSASIELVSHEFQWSRSIIARGLTALPLRFLPASE